MKLCFGLRTNEVEALCFCDLWLCLKVVRVYAKERFIDCNKGMYQQAIAHPIPGMLSADTGQRILFGGHHFIQHTLG